jgi:hypothetical protein
MNVPICIMLISVDDDDECNDDDEDQWWAVGDLLLGGQDVKDIRNHTQHFIKAFWKYIYFVKVK